MNDKILLNKPEILSEIERKSKDISFGMPSDLHIGSFLKTLIASKPRARVLELGTGIGLSLAWMIDGLDKESKLITVDNDSELTEIAKGYFGKDCRVEVVCQDGAEWIKQHQGSKFDVVFADAWPGKYSQIDEILDLVEIGGFYVIDDMSEQPNWPKGHQEKALGLIEYLEKRKDFVITKFNWSTGLILAVKK
ncbi:class I SAM-dependent methyltransferase [uncultured Maribacter sp.]|uniref:O-methyltransferase n=1 Tax=uncultured Maribacter sp. TaxID=431308 RepID=UPI00262A1D24|nr:class I SAM-dependent methyltransferase [uncultured Maribacter sp.]